MNQIARSTSREFDENKDDIWHFGCCLRGMANFKSSERASPNEQEKSVIQRQRLNASYHCSRCGSVQLKIIFKAGDAKVYPYFHCQDCQMEDRIS
jgi:DNA-directed RNA polymerase subunit RPC12/RpoP